MVPEADRAPGLYQRGTSSARPCRRNLQRCRSGNAGIWPRSLGTTSTPWGPSPALRLLSPEWRPKRRWDCLCHTGDGPNWPGGLQTRQVMRRVLIYSLFSATLYYGSFRRALVRNARGRPLSPPTQNPLPSGPHHDRYLAKVAWALAVRWEDCNAFCCGDAGWPDQPLGDKWTASWACGVRMLEAHRAAGIPWATVSSLTYTTAPGLLEGARSHREAGVCSKGDRAAGQGLAQKAGHLADLSACTSK